VAMVTRRLMATSQRARARRRELTWNPPVHGRRYGRAAFCLIM